MVKERIARFRARYLAIEPSICPQRAVVYTQVYRQHPEQPVIILRAMAFARVLREMTIYIDPETLIVGNQASAPRSAPVCPEYAWKWLEDELDSFAQRPSDRFEISPQTKLALREILPFWHGRTQQERAWCVQPEEVMLDKKVGVLGWEGNITAGDGHIVVDYASLVRRGLPDIAREVERRRDALHLFEPQDVRKLYFYRAAAIALNGLLEYIARFAALAKEQAADTSDPERRQELEHIAARCDALCQRAPQSFVEAVQLVWFVHVALHIETNGHSLSLGRIDQYLYPFFAADMRNGRLSRQEAVDTIGCLFIKMFGNLKLRSWSSTRTQLGYPTYQNICLGGQTHDGKDATNELSFLCLDVLAHTRLSEPNLYIRVHPGTPQTFLRKAVEVLRLGFGMPAMVNDEVIVPSLMERGVSKEDALGYTTFGCAEVLVPGKWGHRANGKCKLNVLKVLEISLNGGKDPVTGLCTVKGIAPLSACETFEEVLDGYRRALEYYMQLQVTADNINDMVIDEMTADALTSALVNDCLARGKTIHQGGAVYDIISGCLVGIPNVGNALYAIDELVYKRREISREDLIQALAQNFQGEKNARVQRLLFAGVQKYGNDCDAVDEMVVRTSDFYFKNISRYHNMRYGLGPIGGTFTSSTVTISGNIPSGRAVGATPDGRRAFEPTCDGVSPMHQTLKNGPTAVFNSVSKLSTRDVSGGQLLNMRFDPRMLSSPEKVDKFIALVRGFFRREGWHVQFNMVSNEVLLDAQKHPQDHRDLIVRVAGYSALFTALDADTQNDIINRTEFVF